MDNNNNVKKRKSSDSDEEMSMSTPPLKRSKKKKEKTSTCSICLNKIGKRNNVKLNSCAHIFCKECIRTWAKQENTCPLCRKRFTNMSYYDKNSKYISININNRSQGKKQIDFTISHVLQLCDIINHSYAKKDSSIMTLVSIQRHFDDNPFSIIRIALRAQLIFWDTTVAQLTPVILGIHLRPSMLDLNGLYTSDSRMNIIIYWGLYEPFRKWLTLVISDDGTTFNQSTRTKAHMCFDVITRFIRINDIPCEVEAEPGSLQHWALHTTKIVNEKPFHHRSLHRTGIYRTKLQHIIRVKGMLEGKMEDQIRQDILKRDLQEGESNDWYLQRLPKI